MNPLIGAAILVVILLSAVAYIAVRIIDDVLSQIEDASLDDWGK